MDERITEQDEYGAENLPFQYEQGHNSLKSRQEENIYKRCLDETDKAGHSPFFVAVMKGFIQIASMILEEDMSNIDL